ncbi:MAG: xanthine dehydrogenase family protein subunit M, partial [Deltaproteobacteria bacterium]
AGIGLTNVAALPTRAVDAENALRGQQPSDALFAQAGQLAADASSPADDLRGSAEYKLTLIRELIQRALRRSVERAQGRS